MTLDRVTQRKFRVKLIAVATTVLYARQHSRLLQVRHDALYRPLRNPNTIRYVAQTQLRVCCNTEKHMGMVGEKSPTGLR